VETPQGTASLSLDGQLPPTWPADFPLPPHSTPAGSASLSKATTNHQIAVFETSTSGQEAYNFYKNSSSLDVSQPKSLGVGNSFVGKLQFSGPHTGSVTVSDVNDQTLIVIYLQTSANHLEPVSGAR
jgi:hypothetical protein